MKYTSNAKWPVAVSSQLGHSMTTDTHDTEEQAQGVCTLLRRHGFGGNHEVYPMRTWVEAVSPKGDLCVQPESKAEPIVLTGNYANDPEPTRLVSQPMPKASPATQPHNSNTMESSGFE